MEAPMPLEAPVTRATLLASLDWMLDFMVRLSWELRLGVGRRATKGAGGAKGRMVRFVFFVLFVAKESGRLVGRLGRRDRRGFLHAELFEHLVEDGRQVEAEEGDTDHAGEDGDTHGAAHLGAGTGARDEREDAGDKRDRGHQDRAQAQSRGVERGLGDAGTFLAALDRE